MERYAGIDVAKDTLVVFIRPDTIQKDFSNDEKGRTDLARFLGKLGPDLVVL